MRDAPPIKILIVDDDKFVRSAMVAMLQRIGPFQVTPASNGYDGLDALKSILPEVILCDIGMDGMSGLEFVERVRANEDAQIRAIPIIMLTVNGRGGMILKAMKFGIAGYLLKPVSAKQLCARIESVLKRQLGAASVGNNLNGTASGIP
jgi:two-component system chemotaxis response regulator CheY